MPLPKSGAPGHPGSPADDLPASDLTPDLAPSPAAAARIPWARPAFAGRRHRSPVAVWLAGHRDLVLVAGLALLALAVRLAALGAIPPSLSAAEADNLQFIYHIILRGDPGLFGLDWKAAPAFGLYAVRAFMLVFGDSPTGFRMASALLSTAAVVPFFFLAREHVSRFAAAVAGVLLVTSLWYLHFSRSGWESVHVAFFGLMAAWLLSLGLRRHALAYYAGAGAFAALGLYGYFPGQAILIALLVYLPIAIWQQREQARRILLGYAVLLAVCAVLFAPQVPAVLANWDRFSQPWSAVSPVSPSPGQTGSGNMVLGRLANTIRAFVLVDGSVSNAPQHLPAGQPFLPAPIAILYLLGLVLAIAAFRKVALWWCLLLVPILATQVFGAGAPNWDAAIVAAPFVFLFIAFGLNRLTARPGWWYGVFRAAALVALPFVAAIGVADYFNWMQDPAALQARSPSVPVVEFPYWRDEQQKEIAAGQRGFPAGEWPSRRAAVVPADVAARTVVAPARPGAGPAAVARTAPIRSTDQAVGNAAKLVKRVGGIGKDTGQFDAPRGIAVDADGNVYVADVNNQRIQKLSADGAFAAVWGKPYSGQGEGNGEFVELSDLAIDPAQGLLYALDAGRGNIQVFDLAGAFRSHAAIGIGTYRPRGLGLDKDGNVYVADTGRNRVVKLNRDGQLVLSIGEGEQNAGLLDQPTDVAVDGNGNLYVAEPNAGRIQKLDPTGKPIAWWEISKTETVNSPHLALTPAGHLLMSDGHLNRVAVYDLNGKLAAFWGGLEGGPDGPGQAVGIAVDANRRVAVADARGGQISIYQLGGTY